MIQRNQVTLFRMQLLFETKEIQIESPDSFIDQQIKEFILKNILEME